MITYHAKARPVGRFWHISVDEINRVTQARRASLIQPMVRDLVEVMTGQTQFVVEVEYVLPAEIAVHQDRAEQLRKQELSTRQEAARELRLAAAGLRGQGLTLADVGAVLGVSHQRASQLLATDPK